MQPFMDMTRARELIHAANLDGLVICSPENFFYASGYSVMLLDLYRTAPLGLFILAADENIPPALIVPETEVDGIRAQTTFTQVIGFPVWWEVYPLESWSKNPQDFSGNLSAAERHLPAQYNSADVFTLLNSILRQMGLDKSRLGVETTFISQKMFLQMQSHTPGVQYADSTALFEELRKVKCAREINHLQSACAVTEGGIENSASAIQEGVGIGELKAAFIEGVLHTAREKNLLDELGSVGGQPSLGFYGSSGRHPSQICAHTTIKYDMQVSIQRCFSDVGRTFVFGNLTAEQKAIFAALLEAHRRMREVLVPGKRAYDVYWAARSAMEAHGFRRHARGHFGHSVGLDPKVEEAPFLSADDQSLLTPGMVLAVETPFYYDGIGRFQLEDMVLITEDEPIIFNRLPMDWQF